MSGVSEWLAMGGYAAFVWPSYAVSLLALLAFAIWSWRGMRRAERETAHLAAEAGTRAPRAEAAGAV